MTSGTGLPEKMRALVVTSRSEPPTVEVVPTPKPEVGSAVVRILYANVVSYMGDIYTGKRQYPFPTPIIPGTSAIARVAAVGPDTTKLKPGDLVFVDTLVRSRDNPGDAYLAALHHGFTAGSEKLMTNVYRDWTWAEYTRAPLENLTDFDEKRLTSSISDAGLGYQISQLAYISTLLVPYGGLRDIELQAGQTIIVAPATGQFGGAAVLAALAMGARVIAMGRSKTSLEILKKRVPYPERLFTVPITGDMLADCGELKKHGQIDAFFDIGPAEAYNSTHIKSAIYALRHGARVSLMGGYREDVALPLGYIMHSNLRLYGKWMYERSDIADLIKLIENGPLKLGEKGGSSVVAEFGLEQWKETWAAAAENTTLGEQVLMKP
ncbi:hypothetical protein LTR85_009358 [Meristemomyces frigidus]|nr:hypothetical protein LTR85_009358 [Meristemomyces frigidus]